MPVESQNSNGAGKKKRPFLWLIYLAALLGGFLLLSDAAQWGPATRIPAKLGIGLVYSALAFLVAGPRPSACTGTTLLWITIVLTFVF